MKPRRLLTTNIIIIIDKQRSEQQIRLNSARGERADDAATHLHMDHQFKAQRMATTGNGNIHGGSEAGQAKHNGPQKARTSMLICCYYYNDHHC